MKIIISAISVICFLQLYCGTSDAYASASPDSLNLTLNDVISLAQEQSPAAQSAKHTYLAAEWQYKYYKANYLPSLTLTSSPFFNHSINKITLNDGTSAFVSQNQLSTDLTLQISQNIAPTGGTIFVNSSLERNDEFGQNTSSFSSRPITIGYNQQIFGYNSLKWDRKIEPLKYKEAKKDYNEAMQLVAAKACQYFFEMIEAQTNLEMARHNLANADTLYRMAEGRYKIGTINQNDMLQLEVNKLNEETACMDAEVQVQEQTQLLTSYLGLNGYRHLSLVLPENVPDKEIAVGRALDLAIENGADYDYFRRMRLEAESNVAQAKANSGLKADLYLRFGLSQTGKNLSSAYSKPMDQEYASLTLSLPILDWGRGKGRVKVAQSQLDLANTQADQGITDFMQNITKLVLQFNMQSRKVNVAGRTSQLATYRYEIARRLYISQRNTILDLNVALSEKDTAKRAYISSIKTYWMLYYTIRSIIGNEI